MYEVPQSSCSMKAKQGDLRGRKPPNRESRRLCKKGFTSFPATPYKNAPLRCGMKLSNLILDWPCGTWSESRYLQWDHLFESITLAIIQFRFVGQSCQCEIKDDEMFDLDLAALLTHAPAKLETAKH